MAKYCWKPQTNALCRAPDGLYENGLQRHLFLPFIERLKRETVVHDIASQVDYRRLAQHRRGLFYTCHDFDDPDAEVEAQFRALAEACHEPTGPTEVAVMMGRKLPVPQACEAPPEDLEQPPAVQWDGCCACEAP